MSAQPRPPKARGFPRPPPCFLALIFLGMRPASPRVQEDDGSGIRRGNESTGTCEDSNIHAVHFLSLDTFRFHPRHSYVSAPAWV